jgi:hypothetical protein
MATRRKQGPRIVEGSALRGHECRECGRLFISIQRVATSEELERAEGVA